MRIVRPLSWLIGAAAALAGFVAVGDMVETPLRWGDLGGWLEEATLEDALVEITRWVGMALAGYVLVVAVLVLLVELADAVRAVPAARFLRRLAGLVAVPALRRRLVEASTATAITVSAITATGGGGAMAATPAVEQTVDVDLARLGELPAGVSPADVVGFGYVPGAARSPAAATREAPADVSDGVRVRAGDTVWDLAVAHYGFCDASVVQLIRAANGLEDPNLIYPGQVLVLPALPQPSPPRPVVPEGAATWTVHVVVPGDTLWEILERHYGYVEADLVWGIADYNGFEDPSAIAVGTEVTLPPLAVLTGDTARPKAPKGVSPPERSEEPPSSSPQRRPAGPDTRPALPVKEEVDAGPRVTPPAPTADRDPVPTGAGTPDLDEPDVEQPPPSVSVPAAAGVGGGSADGGVAVAPWLVGLAGSTTLAAGLVAVYRRLRRRQTAAGARAWRLMPSGPSAQLYDQLVAAADLPLVRWAGQELSGVLFGLGRPAAGPVAVELSEEFGIELLWDAPIPGAPAPWEATADGWAWRLLYDAEAEVPEAVLPAAVPGLVTVGRRDGAQVLVDLEAYGSLAITGDARAVEDVMRSIVLELGAGDELSDGWVSTVGLGVDGVEHLVRVRARSDAEALAHATGIAAGLGEVMDAAAVDDTFVLRASGPPEGREVSVIAVRAESCGVVDELLAVARPRCGVAVVVLGDVGGTGARLVVGGDGSARLEPLGMTVELAGVSHEVAANTAVLLDAAAEQVTVEELDALVDETASEREHERPAPDVAGEVAALSGPDGVDLEAAGRLLTEGDDGDVEAWVRPSPALLVRVLGPPRLEPAAKLTRKPWALVVFVASMGGTAAVDAVRNAIWGHKRRSNDTFWGYMSAARAVLGEHVVPHPKQGEGVVRLRDTMTDLQLFEAMADQAATMPSGEALALLVEALELVNGVPFDALDCEQWAIDKQRWRAAKVIEDTAVRAVELALAADDVVAARTAVTCALVGLPGNEQLYRARMRIEHHAGNAAGVRQVYRELVRMLEDLSVDSHDSAEPSPATRELLEQLVNGSPAG